MSIITTNKKSLSVIFTDPLTKIEIVKFHPLASLQRDFLA